ncbi:histidine phosphatase family protein [Kribbella monticola]|uniref:histidine phosphatase family protein n=1 Tax=Kribbella monticola TaxID=2185285 RepID=UPI000DD300F9|nr:histidine phosphatase family protein [Kribbella monticola]
MTVKLIYETHSTTVDNEGGVATGWLPGVLSAAGEREAVELGQRHPEVDAVFSSDLRRAVQTVELAFAGRDIPYFQDWRLRECNYGDLNGAPRERLEPRRRYVDHPFPGGGQSYRQVLALTRSFVADLKTLYDGRTVLVVAHSANRWSLQHLVDNTALEDLVDAPFDWQPGWEYEV